MRILVWVTSLLGCGHAKRGLAIAKALARGQNRVLVVNGGTPIAPPEMKSLSVYQLPALRAADINFSGYLDRDNQVVSDAYLARRQRLLAAAFNEFSPEILITEMFPFGRTRLATELAPLLSDIRKNGECKSVCSVRDILVSNRKKKSHEFARDFVLKYYDSVLVHGDPALCNLGETYPLFKEIAHLVSYTGYVCDALDAEVDARGDDIVVSAGSGVVGTRLLETAFQAAAQDVLEDRVWHLVAGRSLPEENRRRLRDAAASNIRVYDHVENLPNLIAHARASVSQAGYNTVAEGLLTKTPMVLVPFAGGQEDEQTIRATKLAQKGVAVHLPEREVSASSLLHCIKKASELKLTFHIDLGGADTTAGIINSMTG